MAQTVHSSASDTAAPWRLRGAQIVMGVSAFLLAWVRLHLKAPQQLPDRLCATLERLGITFVKLGQGLSLQRDVLPDGYREALEQLHNRVPPFESAIAVATIEAALGQALPHAAYPS